MRLIRSLIAQSRHAWLQYAIVILLTGAFLLSIFPIWQLKLQVPLLSYSWDTIFTAYGIKSVIDTGWAYFNPYVGAPFGSNLLDFPGTDSLHFAGFAILSLFTNKTFSVYNLYYFLGFFLASASAYYVLKRLTVSFWIALPAALAYAFLPYHLMRYEHLQLASYYILPLCLLVFYEVSNGTLQFLRRDEKTGHWRLGWRNWSFARYILILLLAASNGIYYSFFMLVISLFGWFYYTIAEWRRQGMRGTNFGVTTLLLLVFILINLSPYIAFRFASPSLEKPVGTRLWTESETHGLKLSQMLLPSPWHRIDALRSLSETYNAESQYAYENQTSALGLLAASGLVLSLLYLLFGRQADDPIRKGGVLNLALILVGSIGGLGGLFAYLINPSFRALNRFSIIIAFISLAVLAVFIQRWLIARAGSNKPWLKAGLMVGLLALVWFDQVYVPDFKTTNQNLELLYLNDARFAHRMQSELPTGARVYQLPYMYFPEHGPLNGMSDYDHFKPYIYSDGLYWSYGGMHGREGDLWARSMAELPVEQMITELRDAGFHAIYIDRLGYEDGGAGVEMQLKSVLIREPLPSYDQRYILYFLN